MPPTLPPDRHLTQTNGFCSKRVNEGRHSHFQLRRSSDEKHERRPNLTSLRRPNSDEFTQHDPDNNDQKRIKNVQIIKYFPIWQKEVDPPKLDGRYLTSDEPWLYEKKTNFLWNTTSKKHRGCGLQGFGSSEDPNVLRQNEYLWGRWSLEIY